MMGLFDLFKRTKFTGDCEVCVFNGGCYIQKMLKKRSDRDEIKVINCEHKSEVLPLDGVDYSPTKEQAKADLGEAE
jgi:hypothetical protein